MNRKVTWVACATALSVLGFSSLATAQQAAYGNTNSNVVAQNTTTAKTTATTATSGASSTQPAPQLLAANQQSTNQQSTPANAGSSTQPISELQTVTVTGTLIKVPGGYTSPTPTMVITSETMQNMGIVNVGQALTLAPANVSEFTPTAAPGSPFYSGQYVPDLRGLNGFFTTRTLTLIDGQRVVPTSTNDSFDLNFVPSILVQRIDTVTGGASATYGSGAIAGVVNVVMNRSLNGGLLDADTSDSHYNDARQQHVAFAFGHGFFDDRFHFVIGGEYQKTDAASCQDSGRPWCTANYGPYETSLSPTGVGLYGLGSNVRTSAVSPNGVLAAAEYDPYTFTYANTNTYPATAGLPVYQATPDATALESYSGNNAIFGGENAAPGGQGTLENQYTNLLTPVTRGVITAMFTGKLTDSITMDVDLNWGQVQANTPNAVDNTTFTVLGLDNPYLPAGASAIDAPLGYYIGKNWQAQIPNDVFDNTTLKRVAVTLNGAIGDSSWTWDGYGEYGLVNQVEGEPTDFHADEASMALDAIKLPNGQVECRITQALADNPGNLEGAFQQLLGEAGTEYPGGPFSYPAYLEAVALSGSAYGTPVPADPQTGLGQLQQLALLGQNCVPLNPFGNQPLSTSAINYITGPLSLSLRSTQTVASLDTTGNIFRGIGAGPFSMAVGYTWRQEVVRNTFTECPPGGSEDYTLCVAETTDFTNQFGGTYAGNTTANEEYLEFLFPLLKDVPGAHLLSLDVAGRYSQYANTAFYAVGIAPGATNTESFPTWKASLNYEPLEGIRFRATESRDTRAPDARDLYYSQVFVAGSLYGTCFNTSLSRDTPCNDNLIGNVDLRPESANTTTFGIVLTPPQLPGLEFSADWFHIHLVNGIDGGSAETEDEECEAGKASGCSYLTFLPYYYNSAGLGCASGQPAGAPALAGGVACTGPTYTGATAYQNDAANIADEDGPAYNGAFYDERGIDFSLNYAWVLPDGSTLAARLLTTWVGEQVYQNFVGGPIVNLDGETGNNPSFIGLGDFQPDARWSGNFAITWATGPWSVTPNLRWVGQGSLSNTALSCTQAELTTSTNPCDWVYNSFEVTGLSATQTAKEKYDDTVPLTILPMGVANHVPAYFLAGLNVTYTFANVLQGLQLFCQVSNLFNKAPPMTAGVGGPFAGLFNGTVFTSNPVFYDELGQTWQVGLRLKF